MTTEQTPSVPQWGSIATYRAVFAVPGATRFITVALLARIPATAAPITLTLHVVHTLGLGYAAGGFVVAAYTSGGALGAPLLGSLIDRRGLRAMLALAISAEIAFWTAASWMPYPALVVAAFTCGLLGIPIYTVVRQSLAAMMPPPCRRPAFALDSVSTDLGYIFGPALAAVLILAMSSTVALVSIGLGWTAAGIALWLLDAPTRTAYGEAGHTPAACTPYPITTPLVATLITTTTVVIMVYATELVLIAGLESTGHSHAIAPIYSAWAAASALGGFIYGAVRRAPEFFTLTIYLGLATLALGLADAWWSYLLLLVPAGLLCAPPLAASAETIATLAPNEARGVVTGLHGSSITLGAAIATPATGALIDHASPSAAIAVIAITGIGATITATVTTTTAPNHSR
ncbi:MFS transporter [Nocardia sp. NPDC050630]|uniref:MFS transporter n=1 Tax=Nocardia sp. NPDC050630 TaxID=3364321 RepID=UPI00378F1DFF